MRTSTAVSLAFLPALGPLVFAAPHGVTKRHSTDASKRDVANAQQMHAETYNPLRRRQDQGDFAQIMQSYIDASNQQMQLQMQLQQLMAQSQYAASNAASGAAIAGKRRSTPVMRKRQLGLAWDQLFNLLQDVGTTTPDSEPTSGGDFQALPPPPADPDYSQPDDTPAPSQAAGSPYYLNKRQLGAAWDQVFNLWQNGDTSTPDTSPISSGGMQAVPPPSAGLGKPDVSMPAPAQGVPAAMAGPASPDDVDPMSGVAAQAGSPAGPALAAPDQASSAQMAPAAFGWKKRQLTAAAAAGNQKRQMASLDQLFQLWQSMSSAPDAGAATDSSAPTAGTPQPMAPAVPAPWSSPDDAGDADSSAPMQAAGSPYTYRSKKEKRQMTSGVDLLMQLLQQMAGQAGATTAGADMGTGGAADPTAGMAMGGQAGVAGGDAGMMGQAPVSAGQGTAAAGPGVSQAAGGYVGAGRVWK